ncbi:MAG: recombinase family protein [Candidatus Daviesbacteria bacterium]|nr:recombinase family protein [Candidatus Daviesbacteria bacterium]
MNNLIKNAVLYLRVSTEEQVENFSLGTQEEICTREAQFKGYKVTKVFKEEGRSAKTIVGRKILIEMLEYCRKNKSAVEAVIIYKTDRLSRQIFDYLIIHKKLTDLGIKLISATEPTDESAMGKFLGNFFAQIAQFDNDIRSERAKNGMYARFKMGLWGSGRPPLGYLSLGGMIIKDPKKFDLVQRTWDIVATGTKSVVEVGLIMEKMGIKLAKSAMHRTFRNKFYMGVLYSPTYQEEVQGQHPAMVSKDLFNRVQDILDGRQKSKVDLARRDILHTDFPLRRFTKCSKCGSGFTGSWSKGRGGRYAYYYCRKEGGHYFPYVSRKTLHDSLTQILKKITPTDECSKIFIHLLEKEYKKRCSQLYNKKTRKVMQLKKLQDMRNNLVQNHLLGIYSNEVFKAQNEMIEKNIKSIELASDEELLDRYNLQSATEYIEKRAKDFIFTYDNSDLSQKRSLLGLLFPAGFVWDYPNSKLTYIQLNPLFKKYL